jgi:ribosome maturation factor RimP
MKFSQQENKIYAMLSPVVDDLGYCLVSVKITGDERDTILQILAEDPETGSITLDECAHISRALSATLDVEDPIQGRYNLEVSSPGLDRPLTCYEDFRRFAGRDVKLELDKPFQGQKRFRGVIDPSGDEGYIRITTKRDTYELPFASITHARLVVDDNILKKANNAS